MKTKFLHLTAILLVCTLALTGCGAAVKSVTMETAATLVKGDTLALVPEFTFDKELDTVAFDEAVAKLAPTYASSDSGVATVDAKGVITAVDGGEAVITAKATNDITATCTVTVTVPVDSVTAPATLDLQTNDKTEATLAVKVLPDNATNKKVTYTSDNESVATVDETGKVTAVGKGSCALTATLGDKTATTTVTVTVKVTGITLENTSGWIYVGGTAKVVPYTAPVEADATTYTFASDNTKVATVNGNGVITGKAVGSAKITVEGAGYNATYAITVKAKPAPVVKPNTPKNNATAGGATAGGSASGGAGNAGGSNGGGAVPETPAAPAVDVGGAIAAGIGYGQSLGGTYVPGCGGSCAANLSVDSLLASNICEALSYYASLVAGEGGKFAFDIVYDGSYVYVWQA